MKCEGCGCEITKKNETYPGGARYYCIDCHASGKAEIPNCKLLNSNKTFMQRIAEKWKA